MLLELGVKGWKLGLCLYALGPILRLWLQTGLLCAGVGQPPCKRRPDRWRALSLTLFPIRIALAPLWHPLQHHFCLATLGSPKTLPCNFRLLRLTLRQAFDLGGPDMLGDTSRTLLPARIASLPL